jgi:hypothetical protein
VNVVSWLFFGVSVVSLVIQLASLSRMTPAPDIPTKQQILMRKGMLRTAACRVLAAITYVILSGILLIFNNTFPVLSLSVFIAIQFLWQANAFADVILRRQLGNVRKSNIMGNLKTYTKTGVQLLGAVLVAILPFLTGNAPMGAAEWMNVASVGLGAAVVWNTTNHPEWPYGKLIGSALITALTTLSPIVSHGITRPEIMQIVIALITTILVGTIPNAPTASLIPISNMNPEGEIPS